MTFEIRRQTTISFTEDGVSRQWKPDVLTLDGHEMVQVGFGRDKGFKRLLLGRESDGIPTFLDELKRRRLEATLALVKPAGDEGLFDDADDPKADKHNRKRSLEQARLLQQTDSLPKTVEISVLGAKLRVGTALSERAPLLVELSPGSLSIMKKGLREAPSRPQGSSRSLNWRQGRTAWIAKRDAVYRTFRAESASEEHKQKAKDDAEAWLQRDTDGDDASDQDDTHAEETQGSMESQTQGSLESQSLQD